MVIGFPLGIHALKLSGEDVVKHGARLCLEIDLKISILKAICLAV